MKWSDIDLALARVRLQKQAAGFGVSLATPLPALPGGGRIETAARKGIGLYNRFKGGAAAPPPGPEALPMPREAQPPGPTGVGDAISSGVGAMGKGVSAIGSLFGGPEKLPMPRSAPPVSPSPSVGASLGPVAAKPPTPAAQPSWLARNAAPLAIGVGGIAALAMLLRRRQEEKKRRSLPLEE